MELQFHKTACPFLRQIKREVQNQELTQEVRLADGMPDIGRVLGAWGQPLIRSKEWRSGSMQISGGVNAWILYAPEDGGQCECVQTWIPFQMKWDLLDAYRDGKICAACWIRSADARSIAARKLMVRTAVSILAEAYTPDEAQIAVPAEVPADVQLLKNIYPVLLCVEAGEKPFAMEELLTIPGSMIPVEKVLRYNLQPEITDQKVIGDKVVFRGSGMLHILYLGTDGNLYSWEQEIPFSQYAELENTYGQDASASVAPALTGMELDKGEDGQLQLRVGLTGQYLIFDRQMIEVVEDAYSPVRKVATEISGLQMPMVLEQSMQTVHAEASAPAEGTRVADLAFYPEHGRVTHGDGEAAIELAGQLHALYYDMEGNLQSVLLPWEHTLEMGTGQDAVIQAQMWLSGTPQGSLNGGNLYAYGDMLVNTVTLGNRGIPMLTALEIGEAEQPDPGRPSLILRKAGDNRLWDLAKNYGTTVQAIREANGLTNEPDPKQMLLIPVS